MQETEENDEYSNSNDDRHKAANLKIPAERRPTNPKNRPWTPQSSGISREDMRRIVLEMIG
jgi:hypothetical protein